LKGFCAGETLQSLARHIGDLRMNNFICFLLGLIIGGFFGVVVMAIMNVAGKGDDK